MSEPSRFDPVGWFVSACFTILAGAVALVAAVHLVRAIWIWLAVGIAVVMLVAGAVQVVLWWRRRQLW